MTMTSRPWSMLLSERRTSMPSASGSIRSSRTTPGWCVRQACSARKPELCSSDSTVSDPTTNSSRRTESRAIRVRNPPATCRAGRAGDRGNAKAGEHCLREAAAV